MPRRAAQFAEIRDERRQLLIAAATKIFTEKGFAAARMTDIAQEAGLSHGLTYHYFENKDAVFVAVVETAMGDANELMEEALAGPEPAIHRLHHLCSQMLLGAQNGPAYTLTLAQASSSAAAPEKARAVLQGATDKVSACLAKLISQAQEAGQLTDGAPDMLARTFLATISGLAASFAMDRNPHTLPSPEIVMRLLAPTSANPNC